MIAALLLAASLEAQQHFATGLNDLFAYASEPAAAEFEAAIRADPTYALARWGEALALGSDLNTPLTPERFADASRAIARALPVASDVPQRDRLLIEAVGARYSGRYRDRDADEKRYRAMMESLLATYPGDDDAAMMLVEDLLEQNGMTWGEDGKPLGDTSAEILSLIDRTLAQVPRQLFANHLCIHAYDNAPDRTPAIACAQMLDSMTFTEPMEHLAHMPAHVWLELGDGKAALRSSERAWALNPPEKYVGHDAYIGYSAAVMCGDAAALARWEARINAGQLPIVFFSDVPPFVSQSLSLEKQGRFRDAIAVLETRAKDLAGASENLPLYLADVRIGALYFRAGHYREALTMFQHVLTSRPRDPRALFGASQAYLSLGDPANAAMASVASATYWAGAPLSMNDF